MKRLIKRLWTHISSARGETLVETLAAVMVSALAIAMLSAGIVASARINAAAHEREQAVRADVRAALDPATTSSQEGKVTILMPPDYGGDSKEPLTYNVDVHGANDGTDAEAVSYDNARKQP